MCIQAELKKYFELDRQISTTIKENIVMLHSMGLHQMARVLEIVEEENTKLNKELILELKSKLL